MTRTTADRSLLRHISIGSHQLHDEASKEHLTLGWA
jgi:hypothetical protein